MKNFVLLLTLLVSINVSAQTLEDDRLALVAVYEATGGVNWIEKTGWVVPGAANDNPCGWFGVTCNTAGDRVVELNLYLNGLDGTLPAEIGNLTALTRLVLYGTRNWFPVRLGTSRISGYEGDLRGTLPTELGNLVNLEYLDLGANGFSGSIPASIGKMIKLKHLDISYTPRDAGFDPYGSLTGSIPSELGNLVNLTHLNLSLQNLTGNIPVALGALAELSFLDLDNNNFSGSIPASIGNLSKLQYLNLNFGFHPSLGYFGQLSGPIPDLSGLPATAKVHVTDQSFTFAGMESNISRLASYTPQANVPLTVFVPLSSPSGSDGMLEVEAGGTLANNTYKWYKNNVLVATTVGSSSFNTTGIGRYRVEVTNSIATALTLVSEDYVVDTVMPVTMISFSAEKGSASNFLTWQTASESRNTGFDVEKSPDAKTFEKIGFVDGKGDAKDVSKYTFTDSNPYATTYYRLKQLDFDGKFEYSRIISVKNDALAVVVYPNPAQNLLFLKNVEKPEQVVIKNFDGETLLKQTASSKTSINTSGLPTGVYFITIGSETRKVVIQK